MDDGWGSHISGNHLSWSFHVFACFKKTLDDTRGILLAKWLRFVVLLADDYLMIFFDTEWWRTHQEWVHELEIQNNRNGGDQNIQSTADWRGTRVRVTSNGIKWRLFWGFPCFEPPYPNQISMNQDCRSQPGISESMTKQILHPWSLVQRPSRDRCFSWPDYGSCKLGELCRHAHSKEELRTGEWRGSRWRDVNVGRKKHHEYYSIL